MAEITCPECNGDTWCHGCNGGGRVHSEDLPDPPRDLWAEWRRLLAVGYNIEWKPGLSPLVYIYPPGKVTTDYSGNHAAPEQAFRLALAKMEEQDHGSSDDINRIQEAPCGEGQEDW